jgi:hypothetical protein
MFMSAGTYTWKCPRVLVVKLQLGLAAIGNKILVLGALRGDHPELASVQFGIAG